MGHMQRSSNVTTDWKTPEWRPGLSPHDDTRVMWTTFRVPVSRMKLSLLLRRRASSSASTSYGVSENFISHRLTMRSSRSITRSICDPACSSFGREFHEQMSLTTPEMPSALRICPTCAKQTRSNASPVQTRCDGALQSRDLLFPADHQRCSHRVITGRNHAQQPTFCQVMPYNLTKCAIFIKISSNYAARLPVWEKKPSRDSSANQPQLSFVSPQTTPSNRGRCFGAGGARRPICGLRGARPLPDAAPPPS